MIRLAFDALHVILTVAILAAVLPLLATAMLVAMVFDMLTPKRESPWTRQP